MITCLWQDNCFCRGLRNKFCCRRTVRCAVDQCSIINNKNSLTSLAVKNWINSVLYKQYLLSLTTLTVIINSLQTYKSKCEKAICSLCHSPAICSLCYSCNVINLLTKQINTTRVLIIHENRVRELMLSCCGLWLTIPAETPVDSMNKKFLRFFPSKKGQSEAL